MKRTKGDRYAEVFTRENAERAFDQVICTLSKHIPRSHAMRYVSRRDRIVSGILLYKERVYTLKRTTTRKFDKSTGKFRDITAEAVVDQIVDQMVVNVIKPDVERGMDYHSTAISKGRGPINGSNAIRKWMLSHKTSCRYCVKGDVEKCFPSMPHATVFAAIDRKWKDRKLRDLLKWRVSTMGSGHGLIIGNRISQWMCELVFQKMDRFARQKLKLKGYSRNQDDFGFLHRSKTRAYTLMWRLCQFAKRELGLTCKAWQIHETERVGYDFLGFRHYVGKTVLRKRAWRKMRSICMRVRRDANIHACRSFMSRWGWLKHTDCSLASRKYVRRARVPLLRNIISHHDRLRSKIVVA